MTTLTLCTCADHIPSICNGCPSWYTTEIPYYYCEEYIDPIDDTIQNGNINTDTTTGGTVTPGNNTSDINFNLLTFTSPPVICSPKPRGDLNQDCILDEVETYLNIKQCLEQNDYVLTQPQIDWLQNPLHFTQTTTINNYLQNNNCSDEAQEFATYAVNLLMINPDANPFMAADCSSFEYAQPAGALQKGCAVENFNHTFYTIGVNPNGSPYYGEVDSNIPIIYFTMPNWMTNGEAANQTALAVTAAEHLTDLYFYENPYASEYAIGNFFRNTLIAEITALGGTVSTSVEPFPIPNPAEYVRSLIGISNPYNCD